MRRILIPLVCVCSLLVARPAQAGWRDYVSPSKNWQRVKRCCSAVTHKVATYCHDKVEHAKADQAKTWGLKLPANLDPRRPLVICIHGLDSTPGVFGAMTQLLEEQHYQVAWFGFPSDGPIQDDADRLADDLAALHKAYPALKVDLIGHSMGGLVARAYIEGDRYTQPIDHFIAIGPPNHGSPWTRERWLLEVNEQYWLWRTNKDWSPIWMFTDGHGEAADDLKPDSRFLASLNDRGRRPGVKYTIILGDHHILNRFYADTLSCMEGCVPKRHWWGVRQMVACMGRTVGRLDEAISESDGVVPLKSATLAGVSDIVRLHGDHNTLVMSDHGHAPVAWETVSARLAE
ncbi:MAG TPA: alpha/beta fold hydrolase [Tepidisphaeraceae bacterium]|jgi:pimeloyl-ACP methyl ester carboxylesterase